MHSQGDQDGIVNADHDQAPQRERREEGKLPDQVDERNKNRKSSRPSSAPRQPTTGSAHPPGFVVGGHHEVLTGDRVHGLLAVRGRPLDGIHAADTQQNGSLRRRPSRSIRTGPCTDWLRSLRASFGYGVDLDLHLTHLGDLHLDSPGGDVTTGTSGAVSVPGHGCHRARNVEESHLSPAGRRARRSRSARRCGPPRAGRAGGATGSARRWVPRRAR